MHQELQRKAILCCSEDVCDRPAIPVRAVRRVKRYSAAASREKRWRQYYVAQSNCTQNRPPQRGHLSLSPQVRHWAAGQGKPQEGGTRIRNPGPTNERWQGFARRPRARKSRSAATRKRSLVTN